MKKISIRNLIIALLCFTLICTAIGFSIISARLDAYKNKKESFNVVFTKIEEFANVKGGVQDPSCVHSINDEGHTLNMSLTLYSQLDELSYIITVENKGTLKAKIIDVVSTPDYINDLGTINSIKPVRITKTDISGKELSPGESTTLKVVAVYEQGATNGTKKIPYKLSLISSSV